MSAAKGTFAWYELMTTDTAAAAAFYSSVVGWGTRDAGHGMDYTIFTAKEAGLAGLMPLPGDATATGIGPSWTGYISVDDVDDRVAKIVESGGRICKAPTDIPNMLRFAVVADPQGAVFIVFTPNPDMQSPVNPPKPPEVGTISWHELYAGDLGTAFDFYATHFGWNKVTDMDMGSMGIYRIFGEGEKQIGGMMTKPPNIPAPYWGFYFQVDSANAAIERLKSGGGTVLNGPHQVPTGSWIVQATDPQGAVFAVVSENA